MTLDKEMARRGNCRYGLSGLRVRIEDGRSLQIVSNRWNERARLVLTLESPEGRELASPERCTLIDRWPITCCSPR
jgi:hypothetical protein